MNYQDLNGVKTITCNPDEFSVVLVNKAKKNITSANTYVNANFFASGQKYQGKTPAFTLPVNHIICDYENTVSPPDLINVEFLEYNSIFIVDQ